MINMDENTVQMDKNISQEDIRETLKLLKELPVNATPVLDTVLALTKQLPELSVKNGLSFFDVKNHTLLNYITDLTYVILQKVSGKTIENDPAIERLCESRIVLEKMRPIEEKLKYQVDKLLTVAFTGQLDTKDPLRFKANPENLDDGEGNDDDDEEEQQKPNVYVPPKISAAYFNEDMSLEERKRKILERSQKRALSSSVLYELRKEYDTGPEEIKETVDPYKIKLNEEMQERTRYEEEFMLRLPMTKKQRHDARQLTTVTNFDPDLDDRQQKDFAVRRKSKSFGKKEKSKSSKKWKGKKRRG